MSDYKPLKGASVSDADCGILVDGTGSSSLQTCPVCLKLVEEPFMLARVVRLESFWIISLID